MAATINSLAEFHSAKEFVFSAGKYKICISPEMALCR